MNRRITESPTLRDGLVLVLAVMLGQWCLAVFIRQNIPWISWCFCSPPCFDVVFVLCCKIKGDPYNSFKVPVSLSGEGCWDQRQLPRFLLSAFLHTAKAPWYLEGPPSLG